MGHAYTVLEVDTTSLTAKLSEAVLEAGEGAVWVLEQRRRTRRISADLQMLLYNLGAHALPLRLLHLPFTRDKLLLEEMQLRAVLLCTRELESTRGASLPHVITGHPRAPPSSGSAAYRLLKALCSDFSPMQMALLAHVRPQPPDPNRQTPIARPQSP